MEEFTRNFKKYLEIESSETFASNTKFKDLEIWDSLSALSIIAMADDCYNVELSSEDLKNTSTIHDLFEKIKSLQA